MRFRSVRGPKDPRESARGADSERRRRWGIAPHATLRAQSPAAWREPLRAVLAEHPKSTFNVLTVRLTGLTADVCFGSTLDEALWTLAHKGEVEHTTTVPIRWRLART